MKDIALTTRGDHVALPDVLGIAHVTEKQRETSFHNDPKETAKPHRFSAKPSPGAATYPSITTYHKRVNVIL